MTPMTATTSVIPSRSPVSLPFARHRVILSRVSSLSSIFLLDHVIVAAGTGAAVTGAGAVCCRRCGAVCCRRYGLLPALPLSLSRAVSLALPPVQVLALLLLQERLPRARRQPLSC